MQFLVRLILFRHQPTAHFMEFTLDLLEAFCRLFRLPSVTQNQIAQSADDIHGLRYDAFQSQNLPFRLVNLFLERFIATYNPLMALFVEDIAIEQMYSFSAKLATDKTII